MRAGAPGPPGPRGGPQPRARWTLPHAAAGGALVLQRLRSAVRHRPVLLPALSAAAAAPLALPPELLEALGPAISNNLTKLVTSLAGFIQRWIDTHLSDLASGGCPATATLLRVYLGAAALQVLTLGTATRICMLDRSAVLSGQLWRLVTWSLVHGGPIHLLSNYLAMAKLGAQLERLEGPARFTATVVASSALATVASLALSGGRPSLGASGAVFGVVGALWRYHSAHAWALPPEAATALKAAGEQHLQMMAVYHLMLWSRLDLGAHVGGALGGWVVAALVGPAYRLEGSNNALAWAVRKGRVFKDRPPLVRWAESAPRPSIPFPAIGPGYTVAAAAVTGQPPALAGG